MYKINCGKCGAKESFYLWLESKSGLEMPKGQVQCPNCNVAVLIKYGATTVHEIDDEKLFIPGDVTLQVVPSVL